MKSVVCLAGALLALSLPAGAEINQWSEVTFDARVPCGVACVPSDEVLDTCTQSLLPESYDDLLVGPAPEQTRLLELEFRSTGQRDLVICRVNADGSTGARIPASTTHTDPPDCNHALSDYSMPLGCLSLFSLEVAPDSRFLIRVYNHLDVEPAPGRYRFRG